MATCCAKSMEEMLYGCPTEFQPMQGKIGIKPCSKTVFMESI